MKTERVTNVIQVFKTNVHEQEHADMLCDLVQTTLTVQRANFDLQDCDRIFRVESSTNIDHQVIALLHLHGFICEELPDLVPEGDYKIPRHHYAHDKFQQGAEQKPDE